MSNRPPVPESGSSRSAPDGGSRSASRKPAAAAKRTKSTVEPTDGLSRGALAGRIAAGAAIGSAAVAGALLYAGKVDGRTPQRMWDKVKPWAKPTKRSSAKTGD